MSVPGGVMAPNPFNEALISLFGNGRRAAYSQDLPLVLSFFGQAINTVSYPQFSPFQFFNPAAQSVLDAPWQGAGPLPGFNTNAVQNGFNFGTAPAPAPTTGSFDLFAQQPAFDQQPARPMQNAVSRQQPFSMAFRGLTI
jgi:hypothetical protein